MFAFDMLKSVAYSLFLFVLYYAIGFASCMRSKNAELELKYTLICLGILLTFCVFIILFNAFLESKNNK